MKHQDLASFLFSHLAKLGVRHAFGVPGDFILPLYAALEDNEDIEAVVSTHEPCAAFAADGYGRTSGLGVLLVTYGVGGYNALNGVACAFAESSPLLVISGGLPRGYDHGTELLSPMSHHAVQDPADQLEVFARVTTQTFRLEDEETAAATIRDAAAVAVRTRLPVYLEVPTDMMRLAIPVEGAAPSADVGVDSASVGHAVGRFVRRIEAADSPVLLLGVEAARFGLRAEVEQIMEARGIPAAVTPLGKGVIAETHPLALGMYAGVLSADPSVRSTVERSDLVILLGAKVTDVNCGAFTADLRRDRLLVATTRWVGDGYARYDPSPPLSVFVRELAARLPALDSPPPAPTISRFDWGDSDSAMDRYLGVIAAGLEDHEVIVADTGDSLYGSLPIRTPRAGGYVAPAFYNSMGFAVPAALGVQLADPSCRPIVLVGDGAFQMTGLELSSMVSRGLDPIVVLFNNGGYGMQRVFADGSFNDVGTGWSYGRVVDLVGGGRSSVARSPEELETALAEARGYREGPSVVEVMVDKGVISTGLRVLGDAFKREKTGLCPLRAGGPEPCEHHRQCAFCRAGDWR